MRLPAPAGSEAASLPPDVRESLGLLGSAQVEKVLADAKAEVRVRLVESAAQETADAQWSGIWLGGDLERIEVAIDAAVNMLGFVISDDERERVVALLGDNVPF